MNRSLERAALLLGVLILLVALQFCAALGGAAAALVGALLLSAGATWLWLHFDLPSGSVWVPPLICAVLCETVAALLDLMLHPTFFGLFALLPAAAGSSLTVYLLRRSAARCGLCNRSLSASSLVFAPNRAHSLFDLSGRVAIITGGAGLLGYFHGAILAAAGAHVVLLDLAGANPGRLIDLRRTSAEFELQLHGPAAMSIPNRHQGRRLSVHDLRFEFPVHFPAVPMEMYLRTPVFHPNVHPETGFVCLWDRHRVTNTVELALHKLVAILAGDLFHADAPHVMQPGALPCARLEAMPLRGVAYEPAFPTVVPRDVDRRRRLL